MRIKQATPMKLAAASALALGLMVGAGQPAEAAIIQVDHSDRDAAALVAGWNTIADVPVVAVSVVDATGQDDGITLNYSSGWVESTNQNNTGSYSTGIWSNAVEDYFFTQITTVPSASIVISGLINSETYTIRVAASWNDAGGSNITREADYTVNGSFGDGISPANGDNFDLHTDGFDNGAFMTWTGVAPVDGDITLTVLNHTGLAAHVNAFTIEGTFVPEPCSLALMGLGGLCLLKRRRR